MAKKERTISKIPKPCPVCGKNSWSKGQTFRDKFGRMAVISWVCLVCGFERDRKNNSGITPPKPWEHKKIGIGRYFKRRKARGGA